eukprot:GHVL01018500.1.p1 GENE.GHVL01018500.1~~GHVL01018500.1.p1  ORF type:complete len:463 (+),score=57.36 GHVL01018500.1:22-1410(+)
MTCDCDLCRSLEQKLHLIVAFKKTQPHLDQICTEIKKILKRHEKLAIITPPNNKILASFFSQNVAYKHLLYNPNAFLPNAKFLLTGTLPFTSIDYFMTDLQRMRSPIRVADNKLQKMQICIQLGCGRSGTTFLANLISKNNCAIWLNEPKTLFIALDPSHDVWSVKAAHRCGKLLFKHSNCESQLKKVYQMLGELMPSSSKDQTDITVMIDKTPEHCFKVPYLMNILGSNISFVHIVRDGIAVARSISKFDAYSWYGVKNEQKWVSLRELAMQKRFRINSHLFGDDSLLGPRIAGDNFHLADSQLQDNPVEARSYCRGLVEWTLSIVYAEESMDNDDLPAGISQRNSVIELWQTWVQLVKSSPDMNNSKGPSARRILVVYENLIRNTQCTLASVNKFLGLSEPISSLASSVIVPPNSSTQPLLLCPQKLKTWEKYIISKFEGSLVLELLLAYTNFVNEIMND